MKKVFQKCLAFALAAILTLSCGITAVAADKDGISMTTVQMDVTYCQTEARSMLDMINEFRTGEDAWYWNSDNETKTVLTDLEELTYDYALEEIAMQRAAEIALSFSHTRPDNTTCWTAYTGTSKGGTSYYYWMKAENIAAGNRTAQNTFIQWREDEDNYSGQGHRRNMLNSNVTSVGIACVCYEGVYYWVQEFGGPTSDLTAADPNDSKTPVSVDVSTDLISDVSLAVDSATLVMTPDSSVDLPTVSASLLLQSRWPSRRTAVTVAPVWSVSPENIVSISADGTMTATAAGTATLTAKALGETIDITVTVSQASQISLASAQVMLEQDSYIYDGQTHEPAVTVVLNGTTLIKGTDYIVSYKDNVELGNATVTVTGIGIYKDSIDKTFTIELCAHQWDEGVVTIESTCEDAGVRTYTCSICGETKTEEIPATGHTWGEWTVVKEATAEEEGQEERICGECGVTESRPIPKLQPDTPVPKELVADIFDDVTEGAWYEDAIQYVYDKGLMEGNGNLFTPNGQMTRGMFVTTLYRLAGEPEVTDRSACTELHDVGTNAWYTDAVCWAYANKITTGYENDMTFRTNVALSREQLATFLYRYADYEGMDISASDDLTGLLNADKVKPYAEKEVKWAVGAGMINGMEIKDEAGNTVYDLAPQKTATRAQMAQILRNFCEAYDI